MQTTNSSITGVELYLAFRAGPQADRDCSERWIKALEMVDETTDVTHEQLATASTY